MALQTQRFLPWFNEYTKQALVNNERRLVVLSGTESWALSLLEAIDIMSITPTGNNEYDSIPLPSSDETCLIYGDSRLFSANVQQKRFSDKLGSESDFIIFADSQFTVDAFAALSGTLKAGGIFFLVMPSLREKCEQSPFFKRFYGLIQANNNHLVITESLTKLIELTDEKTADVTCLTPEVFPLNCITKEQYKAVVAINKVVSGHRKRPLVLTADRGRGKSSALAIACAELLKEHEYLEFNCIITAPDKQSLTVFYRQLKQSLNAAEQQDSKIVYGKASLTFMAVDQLIRHPLKAHLVLVDEAAAIPVYLLEQLLAHYHRIVFSSTVHGYEGAGRGFTLKFQKVLDNVCPQWNSLHINQPIRWRKNDPLEQLVFDTCLLNAELPEITSMSSSLLAVSDKGLPIVNSDALKALDFKIITTIELLADKALLKQVFAVLVTAHYQTKPSDLQLLLDNPQVQVACIYSSRQGTIEVVAVALLMTEGANNTIEDGDVSAIKNSQRRLRNHFIPQSLLSHCGFEQAFDYRYLRIMRIAVHPQCQQRGIGCYFINAIARFAKDQRADFIGSSFGANHQLLKFWFTADFTPVRIGFTKDKASGEHSALMIKGLNKKAEQHQSIFQGNFYRSFDYLLLEEYNGLSAALIQLLLKAQPKGDLLRVSEFDIANVHAYSTGERLFSTCVYSLYLWFKQDLLMPNTTPKVRILQGYSLEIDIERVLIARLIQKQDVKTVCQQYGFTGKKMLNQTIKNYVSLRLSTSHY